MENIPKLSLYPFLSGALVKFNFQVIRQVNSHKNNALEPGVTRKNKSETSNKL